MNRICMGLALAVALSGCVTRAPHVIAETSVGAENGSAFDGQATFYVFRGDSFYASAWPTNFGLDGIEKASLRRNAFARFAVPAGRHVLATHWNPLAAQPGLQLSGSFEAGRTYYFRCDAHFVGPANPTQFAFSLEMVSPSRGHQLISAGEDWTGRTQDPSPETTTNGK